MEKDYLIEKWLNNDLTEDEKKAFESMEDYSEHLDILEAAEYFKASHISEVPDFKSFKKKRLETTPVRRLNWQQNLFRVAAMVAIMLGIYFTFFTGQQTEVQTLAAQKTTIQLPDNSTVILNALSDISFSESNWDDNRELQLQGEAYFKVAKGKVFDVITEKGTVTVVGTEFNVKHRGDYFEVKCYEGIVLVDYVESQKQLIAGEAIRIIGDEVYYKNLDNEAPEWTQNNSYFDAVPFGEVVAELERQFDIKVNSLQENAELLFTGGFSHDNLNEALKSITQPLKLTYRMDSSNEVTLQKSE